MVNGIYGWAWEPNVSNAPVNIDICDGYLTGYYACAWISPGFARRRFWEWIPLAYLHTAPVLKDGTLHTIRVKISGTAIDLFSKSLVCNP
jgi:hypothetical protein